MFKKNDKIKVNENSKIFAGKSGIVLDANDHQAKVKLNIDESNENPKFVINIFENADLELDSVDNLLTEDTIAFDNDVESVEVKEPVVETVAPKEEVKEGTTLLGEDFAYWLADHNANVWSQEIDESNNCPIHGEHGQVIGLYNVVTGRLMESLYDTDTIPSIEGEHTEEVIPDLDMEEEDYIHDYLYDENIDDLNDVVPSWEFVSTIATAEELAEEDVVQDAIERGYKLFVIRSSNYERLAVAAKGIKADDIYADYANYLQGNPTVTEITSK